MSPSSQPVASPLAELVAPDEPHAFLAHVFGKRPALIHGARSRLPGWLALPVFANPHELLRSYGPDVTIAQGKSDRRMQSGSAKAAAQYLNWGLTMMCGQLHTRVPELHEWLVQLAAELGVPAHCLTSGAFISGKRSGFSMHYDSSDSFWIQLQGIKTVSIARNTDINHLVGVQWTPTGPEGQDQWPQFPNGFPEGEPTNVEKLRLEPGSVLYLPGGTWHATTNDHGSFSVHLFCKPPRAAVVVPELLRALLLQSERWRQPLYGLSGNAPGSGAALAQLQALLADLPALVQSIGPLDLVRAAHDPVERSATITPDARFQRDIGFVIETKEAPPDEMEVIVKRKTYFCGEGTEAFPQGDQIVSLTIEKKYEALVKWIDRSRAPFVVADIGAALPDLEIEHIGQFVSHLAKFQAIQVLWYPALPNACVGSEGAATAVAARIGDATNDSVRRIREPKAVSAGAEEAPEK